MSSLLQINRRWGGGGGGCGDTVGKGDPVKNNKSNT
jgi:hypothetical protein